MSPFPNFRMNSILNLMNVLIYTGIFVYFISRLTPIPYSEYYCYGTIMLAIFVSMVVMLGISTKNVKEIGIIQMIIRLFKTCTPGILIIIQLLSLIVLFINAPPPKAITELFSLSDFNTSLFSSILKYFSPFFLKISEIFIKQIFSIFASVSINFKSAFLATILPKVVLPTPIIPNKTRFFLTLT